MIITKTPYRVSFFGGGTDYSQWFKENGGLVISSAINKYCYISVRRLPHFFEYKTRAVYSVVEEVNSHSEIKHPAIRSCLEYLNIQDGLEIHHDGDLPARTGIGSSSSFTVGMLLALHGLNRRMITKKELADEAIKLEQEVMGEDVGIQDQILASHGGFQVLEMGPGDQYNVSPLLLPSDYLQDFEQHVLLAFTGISRFSTKYAKKQINNIQLGNTKMQLTEMLSITREALDLFSKQESFKTIGKLIDYSWQLKRSLAEGVSNSLIDELYASAKKAGAYGGKILGAGGGGFVMFLAPPEKHQAIKDTLGLKVWVPYKIDTLGAQVMLHNGE